MSRPLVFAVLLAFFADFSSCRRIKRTGVASGTDGLTATHGFHSAAGLAHLQFGLNVGAHGDPAAAPALVVYDYMDVDQVPGTVSSGTQKGNNLELHTTLPSDGTTSASVSRRRTFDFGPTHSFFGSEFGTSQRSSLAAHSQVLTRQQLPETSTISHGRGRTSRLIQATTVSESVNGGDSTSSFAPVAPSFDDRVATAFALKGSAADGTKATPFPPGLTISATGPGSEREPSNVQIPVATDIGLRQGLTEATTSTPFSEHTEDPKRFTTASAGNQTVSFSKPSTDAAAAHSTPGLTQSTTGFSDEPHHPNISTPATTDSNLQQGHSETPAHVAGPVSDSTVSAGTNDSLVRNVSAGHADQGFTTSTTKDESSDHLASTSPMTTTAKKLEESSTLVSSTPFKGTHQPSTAASGTTATLKPAPDSSTVFEPHKVAAETTSTVSHTFQQTLPPTRVPSTAEPRPPTAKPTVDAYVRPITEHSVDQFVPHHHRDEIEAYGHEDDHVRGSRCGRCQRKLHTCVEKCFLHHSCEAEANSELSCPRINAPCFPPFKYEVDQCKHSRDCEGTNHLCCLVGCSRKCVLGVRANHWPHP